MADFTIRCISGFYNKEGNSRLVLVYRETFHWKIFDVFEVNTKENRLGNFPQKIK
jgi:hypothetical protein